MATSYVEPVRYLNVVAQQSKTGVARCFLPLSTPYWEGFVQSHPHSSVFHSSAWLRAISRTYGYEPVGFTTSPEDSLEDAVLFCKVESWVTGRRLVSLPFSDHCAPLVDPHFDWDSLSVLIDGELERENWRYVEFRPFVSLNCRVSAKVAVVPFTFHRLDLSPSLGQIFNSFHKDSTQRKIRRAEREGLLYKEGTHDLLDEFYNLMVITRGRHGLPTQPKRWFANLIEEFGEALKICVALKNKQVIAAIMTLSYKDTLVYKYGGCDPRHNNLGSMHLLLWNSIQEAKSSGLRWLDFGRTDAGQDGLIIFKRRWGTEESVLNYYRYSRSKQPTHVFDVPKGGWKTRAVRSVLNRMPPLVLGKVGALLYRHVG